MAGKGDISAGRAFVELFVKQNKLVDGLNAASRRLKSFGASVAKVGAVFAGFGTSITAPLIAMTNNFVDAGDKLHKMSLRTNVSVKALSELKFAAEQSGTNIDQLGGSIFRMRRRIANAATGTGPAVRALAEMGVNAAELAKQSGEVQFNTMVDELAQVENPARRAQLAFEILGDEAKALMPLLDSGADGIKAMREQAAEFGFGMTQQDANNAANLADAMNLFNRTLEGIQNTIGSALAPMLTGFANTAAEIVKTISQFVFNNRELVRTIFLIGAGITAAGTVLIGLGGAIAIAGVALGGLATGITAIGGVVAALVSPFGLVAAAVAGGLVAFLRWTETGRQAFAAVSRIASQMAQTMREAFGGISDALRSGDLELAAQIGFNGLRQVALQALTGLSEMIGGIWGDVVAGIGGRLLDGDVQGAWNIALEGLSSAWSSFTSWITGTMASLAKRVVSMWASAASAVSKMMLRIAKNTGVLGSLLAGTDLNREQERANDLNNAASIITRRRNQTKILEELNSQLVAAEAAGDTQRAAQIRRGIANTEAELAKLANTIQGAPDVTNEAQNIVAESFAAMAAGMGESLDEWSNTAAQNADNALQNLASSTSGSTSDLMLEQERLRAQQAELIAQAKRQADEARSKTQAEIGNEEFAGIGGVSGAATSASFSAAALLAQVGNGTDRVQERIANETAKHRRVAEETLAAFDKMAERLADFMTFA